MRYSVSDFLNTYRESLRCIAGAGGFARAVNEIVLLDYELVPGLKNAYQRKNFSTDQLVLTSFLYARDNPHLITEAIKYLVAQGTSGLAIRNVFHLPIPEQAIRYANVRNFPLFLVTDDSLYFDRIVYEVNRRADELASADYARRILDAMLAHRDDPGEVSRLAIELNPSFKSVFVVLHLRLSDMSTPHELSSLEHAWRASDLAACENVFARYEGGIIVIMSADTDERLEERRILDDLETSPLSSALADGLEGMGVSMRHYGLESLGAAVKEALQASRISEHGGGAACLYGKLGMLRAVLPFAGDARLMQFSSEILDPIREHDSEHGTSLEETLRCFVAHGRSVEVASRHLGQHANTVRYRLERIAKLTGLDFRHPDDADQLAMACRISLVNELFA